MPASCLIDDERRTIFSRAWGVLTDADVVRHNRALVRDLESGMAWIGLAPGTPWPAEAPDRVVEDA